MHIKKLAIFGLVFALLALSGCDSAVEKEVELIAAEETIASLKVKDQPVPEPKPEKDEHKAQLIEYAESYLDTLTFPEFSSSVDATFSGNEIRFGLMDFSDDGKPELVAYATQSEGSDFFKIYFNDEGSILEIGSGHTGGFEGGYQGISLYEGKYYYFHESFSSATGMEMGLSQFDPTEPIENAVWYNAEEAKYGINGETFELEGNLVNGVDVSDEEFEAYREKLTASLSLTFEDFYTLKELKKLS